MRKFNVCYSKYKKVNLRQDTTATATPTVLILWEAFPVNVEMVTMGME